MNIPENGKVVVIDDKYEEVESLLKVLSKNKVPVMYFTGNVEELPDRPFSDVRIIFLDIVLGTEGQQDKTKISSAIGVINSIIGANNTPYLIILWTKHKELIDGIKDAIKDNPPLLMLNLEKSECKNEKGEFDIGIIENKLRDELKKVGIFHLFIIWENLVHISAGKIVNDFSSFYPLDDNWNKNMSGVFHKLAGAYAGKQLKDGETDKLIKDALLTFNCTFLDTLENEIRNYEIVEELKINDSNNVNDDIIAQINSRLHLIFQLPKNSVPGNIYEWNNQVKIDDLFNGNIEDYPQKDNFIRNLKYILLEVSPSCDYAQDKWKLHRILYGLMWPKNEFSKIKKADYIYTSPIFKVDSEIYKFVFDLRHLAALPFDALKDKHPIFRIRHELLVDIQSKIAGHINRPGVICLE